MPFQSGAEHARQVVHALRSGAAHCSADSCDQDVALLKGLAEVLTAI
jgi:hypothetical protein